MTFAIVLVATVLACLVLRGAIHKAPLAFYALAVAIDIAYAAICFFGAPLWLWKVFFLLIQKCLLPLALFTVVMYIGCFPGNSKPSQWLRPIRSELSIIACILVSGHMIVYLLSYLSHLFEGVVKTNVALAFAVAVVLLVLWAVLGVTSFNTVKRRMRKETWVKVQRWAYVFFGLTYVHLLLMLLPSALRGGATAQASVAVYSVVFIGYLVARLVRARRASRTEAA